MARKAMAFLLSFGRTGFLMFLVFVPCSGSYRIRAVNGLFLKSILSPSEVPQKTQL